MNTSLDFIEQFRMTRIEQIVPQQLHVPRYYVDGRQQQRSAIFTYLSIGWVFSAGI